MAVRGPCLDGDVTICRKGRVLITFIIDIYSIWVLIEDKKKSNMLKKVIASIQRSHVIVFNRNRSGLYIIVSMHRKKQNYCVSL